MMRNVLLQRSDMAQHLSKYFTGVSHPRAEGDERLCFDTCYTFQLLHDGERLLVIG
jgi:hypothetical protein